LKKNLEFGIKGLSSFFAPILGMIVLELLNKYFPSFRNEKGVVSVLKVLLRKDHKINFLNTLFVFISSIITLGSGLTLGPEGPAAQIGSGTSNKISQILKAPEEKLKVFTAAGAAAAIAGIFNAPLA
jgi:CIC family chloride channel protein